MNGVVLVMEVKKVYHPRLVKEYNSLLTLNYSKNCCKDNVILVEVEFWLKKKPFFNKIIALANLKIKHTSTIKDFYFTLFKLESIN